jgi:hypothetical protein
MTPQEKAEELFNNFFDLYPNQDAYFIAKQCALICVEELLKDKEIIDGMRVINDPYWLEVKQEIEKL